MNTPPPPNPPRARGKRGKTETGKNVASPAKPPKAKPVRKAKAGTSPASPPPVPRAELGARTMPSANAPTSMADAHAEKRHSWLAAGTAMGIGSAALVAALLYARRHRGHKS